MSEIIRYNGNVEAFAKDAPGTERTIFNENIQSDSLDANINNSYKRGFGIYGPTDLPTRADFNGFGFTVSQMIAYLYQKGIAEWNINQEFFIDNFTNFNGKIYVSNIDSNIGFDPSLSTNWSLLSSSSIAFDGTGTALISDNFEDAVKEILTSMVYPIGSIYQSTLNSSVNPSVTLGFGTWTQIVGRFLIGVDSTDAAFDTAGEIGGNRVLTGEDHVLTEAQMPSHNHTIGNDPGSTAVSGNRVRSESQATGVATTDSTGGGLAHNHSISGETDSTSLPPFIAAYMWQRTA